VTTVREVIAEARLSELDALDLPEELLELDIEELGERFVKAVRDVVRDVRDAIAAVGPMLAALTELARLQADAIDQQNTRQRREGAP